MPSFFTTFVAGVPVETHPAFDAPQSVAPTAQSRARRLALAAGLCLTGVIAARLGWGAHHAALGGMIGLTLGALPWWRVRAAVRH